MEGHVSSIARNMNSQNSQKYTDSQISEKSEPGSMSIITSKPAKNCKWKLLGDDEFGPSISHPRPPSSNLEHRPIPSSGISFVPTSNNDACAPDGDVAQEAQQFRRRIPSRTKSTPDLTNKTAPYNFHGGLRRRGLPQLRSESQLRTKVPEGNLISTSSKYSSAVLPRIRTQPPHTLRNREPRPAAQGTGVFGLLSRLTSVLSNRPLETLDEQVLNDFNMEVGTVISRVDMWRQKLEDERSMSVRSHTLSANPASPQQTSSYNQAYSFISSEIQHLLHMTSNLASSLFGSFTLGFFGMEGRLMVLLQMGSNTVFPVIEILVMNIWRMLREFLNLHGDDTEKIGGLRSVIEAINNAFYAIKSLIHLGKAYRNAQEPSDSDYTGGDSRSVLSYSHASYNLLGEDEKYD